MANQTSQHILSTAANLLGFCLFVITSLHISNAAEGSMMDELTSLVAVLLTFACLFSFISLRTHRAKIEKRLETLADYLFIVSLSGILIIILMIAFNFIR